MTAETSNARGETYTFDMIEDAWGDAVPLTKPYFNRFRARLETLRQSAAPPPAAAQQQDGGEDAPGSRAWMAEVCRAAARSLAAHGVHNDQLSKVADWITQQPPTSAPVGVKTLSEFMAEQESLHPGIHDKVQAATDELRASLAQQPAAVDEACGVAAIRFALTDPEGMTFLRLWNEGEFDTLRREWPDAPSEVYVGADPLATQHQEPTT